MHSNQNYILINNYLTVSPNLIAVFLAVKTLYLFDFVITKSYCLVFISIFSKIQSFLSIIFTFMILSLVSIFCIDPKVLLNYLLFCFIFLEQLLSTYYRSLIVQLIWYFKCLLFFTGGWLFIDQQYAISYF